MQAFARSHVAGSARPHRCVYVSLVAALSAALASSIARGDVFAYAVARQVSYAQTSDAQPAGPDFWDVVAILAYDVPDEVLSSTLEFDVPPPVSYDLYQAIPTLHQYYSSFYTSEAECLADYPETTYTLTADRGAGPETGSVFVAADLYCPEIPYFTGDTFTRLQSYDTSLPFDGTINGFTLAPGTDLGYCYVVVVQEGVGGVVTIELQPEDTAFQIPAGTLLPGTNYSISVAYTDLVRTENGGFEDAIADAIFERGTSASFTTLDAPSPCCPGDMNGDGEFNGLDVQGFVDALLSGQTCP